MKIKLKKIISVLLVFMMLVSCFAFSASSVSISDGLSALRGQWSRGSGPKKGGYTIDYSFYSPKKGNDDTAKYPLVVFLPGAGEGSSKGKELTANNFAYWSSEEYQVKFENAGGAYLLIARAPEETALFWDSPLLTDALFAAIDDFVNKNPNVDRDRISVAGWSLGSSGAIMLVTGHPDYFSAGVFMASRYIVSSSQADKLKNVSTWIIACTNDSYSVYDLYSGSFWSKMKSSAADKSKIRLTTCSSAPNITAIGVTLFNHNVFDMVARDMTSNEGCTGVKTIDGGSNTIDSPSVISWLSQQRKSETSQNGCSHQCHSSGISKFFWTIQCFFYRIFGMSSYRYCECGAAHW